MNSTFLRMLFKKMSDSYEKKPIFIELFDTFADNIYENIRFQVDQGYFMCGFRKKNINFIGNFILCCLEYYAKTKREKRK